jgi:hypothetical protein
MVLLIIPAVYGDCPNPAALAYLKHQIAYERTLELDALRGLSLIHTDV